MHNGQIRVIAACGWLDMTLISIKYLCAISNFLFDQRRQRKMTNKFIPIWGSSMADNKCMFSRSERQADRYKWWNGVASDCEKDLYLFSWLRQDARQFYFGPRLTVFIKGALVLPMHSLYWDMETATVRCDTNNIPVLSPDIRLGFCINLRTYVHYYCTWQKRADSRLGPRNPFKWHE